jgi:hypothetical protein
MPFVEDILRRGSVSIVGLAKNAGKTEVLNYVLRRIGEGAAEAAGAAGETGTTETDGETGAGRAAKVAVTSIGIDGEAVDQVKRTPKPEIEIPEGMIFTTSETHYRQKRLVAEVLDVGRRETALGRLVTARATTAGKVILSGPSDTAGVRELIQGLWRFGVSTVLVDGALSRLSHGSPAVTEGMVLVTGAAVSGNMDKLVRETKYVYDRTRLPAVSAGLGALLSEKESGVWAVDEEAATGATEAATGATGVTENVTVTATESATVVHDLGIPSVLALGSDKGGDIFRFGRTLYVPGVVSERLLEQLRVDEKVADTHLVVRDFTRIFASAATYYSFLGRGGRISVLQRSEVLAVCINPTSPEGYRLDGEALTARMTEALGVAVYDVKKMR